MRKTLKEGASFADMPRFGYGRILSGPTLRARYWTASLFGWRLFVASGHYAGWDEPRRWRWWFIREG